MAVRNRNLAALLTTHGFGFVARNKGMMKLLAICIGLTSLVFGMSQIVGTFEAFLLFGAKTALTVDEFESIEFPAITICPTSVYKRSEIGMHSDIFSSAYSNAYRANLFDSMQITPKLCADPNAANTTVDFKNSTDLKRIFFDSIKTVMQCKLNGKPWNCSRLFLNKNTELGWCFTYNEGANIMSQYTIEGLPLNGRRNYDAYGTTPHESETVIMRSGLRNGLQILFNINMSQTCIPVVQYLAGMAAMVHDPHIEPFLSTKPLTMLPPGFATNVAITFRKNQRNTESIGKCKSHLNLKWFPTTRDYTNSDVYIINCLTSIVVKKCNCLPYFTSTLAKYVQNFSGIFCGDVAERISESDCMAEAITKEYLYERTCYHGNPIPCQEFQVTSQSVSKLYPSPNMLPSLKRRFNLPSSMTLAEFRLNFLLANFYVKRRETVLMTENPAMTWIDLLNKAGGTLGMCLGMSLVSVVELVTLVPISFISWMRKMWKSYVESSFTPTPYYHP